MREESFAGFSLPGAIPVPEEVWVLLPDLGEAGLKVLLFLFRKALGFWKREDAEVNVYCLRVRGAGR
ncbi:MAG: hypothetical protein N2556_04185 [Anaerolineae bacterium]|nr:hypothetical protein [Anaerolineae bacterium]